MLDETSELAPKLAAQEGLWGKKSKPDATFVYAIQMGDLPFVKIGSTKCVQSRLSALQTASPIEVRLIGKITASKRVEKSLHEMFRSSHERREWFRLDERVKPLVSAMAASDFGPDLELHLINQGVLWQSPDALAVQSAIAEFLLQLGV